VLGNNGIEKRTGTFPLAVQILPPPLQNKKDTILHIFTGHNIFGKRLDKDLG